MLTEKRGKRQCASTLAETAGFRDLVKAEVELNEPKVRAFAEWGGVGGGEIRKL